LEEKKIQALGVLCDCLHHLYFGFRVLSFSGIGFWVLSSGFRVSGFGFRVSNFGFEVSSLRFRVSGFEFWGSSFGRVSGSRLLPRS
jgi:hypothetical protein